MRRSDPHIGPVRNAEVGLRHRLYRDIDYDMLKILDTKTGMLV